MDDEDHNAIYYTETEIDALLAALSTLADADGDTKITVEESADEDIIRFYAFGTAMMVIGKREGVDIFFTADANGEHAMELHVDAAAMGDVKALDIAYITGAIAAGDDEAIVLANIVQFAANGGQVFGVEVLSTDGGADAIYAVKAGAVVGPILQESGVFANPTTGTNDTPGPADVAAMIDGSTGTNTTIFVADNDYILIGAAAPFTEIEFRIETPAANPGIKPTYGYSTAGAHQFTPFSPVDGTNGFRDSGIIAWDAADLTSHGINTDTGTYDIKITRTHAVAGSVSLFYAKTAATVVFYWDKDGNVSVLSVITDTISEKTAAAGVTIDSVLLKDGLVDGIDVAARDHPENHNTRHTDGSDDIQTATTAQKGVVSELATAAEANAGTDSARVVTPSVLPVLFQNTKYSYAADTGSADNYAMAPTPAIGAYAAGQVFYFRAANANTGASTLAVSGLATRPIVKNGTAALSANDIKAGQTVGVIYDATSTNFEMFTQLGNAAAGGGDVASDAIWDAAGDLVVADGADSAVKLPISAPAATFLNVLGLLNGETTPTYQALFDATNPVTQAHSDAAATGSSTKAARRDHKHGMPAGGGGGAATREIWVPPYATITLGRYLDWPMIKLATGITGAFALKVPPDFVSLNSIDIVLMPNASETVQADFFMAISAAGEAGNADTETQANKTKAITIFVITEWEISGYFTGAGDIAANDYLSIGVSSDIDHLQLVGLRFSYENA